MKAFHAYDIRGIYNVEWNKEDVYKIGFFLPRLLNANKVLVGMDARLSGPEIFEFLCKGITDSGADVYDSSFCTTPMIYWSTAKFGFAASVMITASHNSKEYNGLKVSGKDAAPIGYDNGLKEIEGKLTRNEPVVVNPNKGKVIPFPVKEEYLGFQNQYLSDFSNLKMAVDCSSGMAGLLVHDLFRNKPIYINDTIDGSFPGHEPNPLVLKNVKQLQETVLKNHCDVGIIFDGDADRVMFVDEKGEFVSPDLIIALLANYFLVEKAMKGNVLQDIRTSKSVTEYIENLGSRVHTWKVGRAFAAPKLKEIDGLFGGELAGHYYFRDFYYSDSGIIACLLVLHILAGFKKKGRTFSSLIDEIRRYANSGEINFKVERKQEAMDAVMEITCSNENPVRFYDFDGYRIEFEKWWFNIRPSNTEPYLRLLVEAKSPELLQMKIREITSIINIYESC
jgi:phosphomannomutase